MVSKRAIFQLFPFPIIDDKDRGEVMQGLPGKCQGHYR